MKSILLLFLFSLLCVISSGTTEKVKTSRILEYAFSHNSHKLIRSNKSKLSRLAEVLQLNKEAFGSFSIFLTAISMEEEVIKNEKIGEMRSDVIKNYLVKCGLEKELIFINKPTIEPATIIEAGTVLLEIQANE